MVESARVRRPAVAGSFYPKNAQTLRRDIESFLSRVPASQPEGRPLVLIEPHAGYMYSGQVAAYGYKLIEGLDIRTVVVVSPSHMEYFPFASVFEGDAYETPLGRIAVNREAAHAISSHDPEQVRLSNRGHIQPGGHRQEHALEVQLPFLQTVLKDFRIVPIVMGEQNWALCEALGKAIAPEMKKPGVLVVVSSDLSHFHDDESARKLDSIFCELVEKMDPRGLYDSIRRNRCEACGAGPVIAALIAGKEAGATDSRVLNTANSGDVTGDRDSVVGYAASVLRASGKPRESVEHEEAREEALTSAEQSYLLGLARRAVESAAGIPSASSASQPTDALLERRGAFVTLKIAGRLRGCIGMVEPAKPLKDTIEEMARAAATSDPRFDPVDADEIPSLDIEVSVLSPLSRIRTPKDIVIGKHGLVVERGARRGLLLPQVASEARWDVEKFLGFTCEKAGLPRDAWKDKDTRIFVFSAFVFGERKKGQARNTATC